MNRRWDGCDELHFRLVRHLCLADPWSLATIGRITIRFDSTRSQHLCTSLRSLTSSPYRDALVLVIGVLLVRLLPFLSIAVVVVVSGVQRLL